MTNEEKHQALSLALEQFKAATSNLQRVWDRCGDYPSDAFENYPACLPDFNEFVFQVNDPDFRVTPGYVFADEEEVFFFGADKNWVPELSGQLQAAGERQTAERVPGARGRPVEEEGDVKDLFRHVEGDR